MSHNVVFRYTETAGAYAGAITWSVFESKEDFDAWLLNIALVDQEVIAQGVSVEEAIALSSSTPIMTHIAVAIAESTDPDTGVTNEDILRIRMVGVMLAL